MTAIQRFALHGTIMNPHSNGPYVRHEDHLAAMQGRCLAQIEEPAQPVAPVLDDRWKARMLDGRAPVRDEMGFGNHPELPWLDEGMMPRSFFAALGLELVHTSAEDQLDGDVLGAMSEAVNWTDWQPTAPQGDGWKLVSIFDTEDGPVAWWLRELPEAEDGTTTIRILQAEVEKLNARIARAGAAPAAVLDVHAIAAAVCQRVAELPDRDSPEDWPEAMLVTGPELIDAVADEIEQALAQAAPALEAPAAPAPAVPDGWRLVPVEFLRGFGTLAHNYSLTAIAPDHYWGNERSAFSDAYARCGQDLVKLRDMLSAEAPPLAAAPQAPAAPVGKYTLVDEGGPVELAGAQAQYSIERADGSTAAWILGDGSAVAELMAALRMPVSGANAAAPAAPAVDASALGEWVATLEVDSEGGLDYETVPPCTLPPGCYRLYRAAQAKEGGEAA